MVNANANLTLPLTDCALNGSLVAYLRSCGDPQTGRNVRRFAESDLHLVNSILWKKGEIAMKRNRLLALSLALPAALLIIGFSVHASLSETAISPAASNSVPSGPSDWPQWRGPERNGVSKDTGLIKQWPSSGPQ